MRLLRSLLPFILAAVILAGAFAYGLSRPKPVNRAKSSQTKVERVDPGTQMIRKSDNRARMLKALDEKSAH